LAAVRILRRSRVDMPGDGEGKVRFGRALKISALSLAGLAAVQTAYFALVCAAQPDPLFKPDVAVVYGGDIESSRYGISLARSLGCPLYLSETLWKLVGLKPEIKALGSSVSIEPRALTTDQNARYAAPFIRQKGFRNIALVCAWHHEPRALFLARLYLIGSGVRVRPYPYDPTPPHFLGKPIFWVQMVKFWGSLGRVALHWVGIDNWPRPQLIGPTDRYDASDYRSKDLEELRKYRP
jgi:DUF218 domain